ncbi:dihydroneopterin aldolase [Virgibacillus siamensis]|uniref:dihydroneopterin aldolase n=1 Tax=Virgibacillus siamensis TaxID=480071 RepID=UPI0009853143|nr:dihydroneopterin aldolase [Virgibacillus siamensis]
MDKIMLNQMEFYGFHGLYPEENKLGQRFYVNTELMLDLTKSATTDDMKDSIDYGEVYECVKGVVEGSPKNLIEAVAEDISVELFQRFTQLQACTIRVIKPDPPIPGHYQSVGVEIFRERKQ